MVWLSTWLVMERAGTADREKPLIAVEDPVIHLVRESGVTAQRQLDITVNDVVRGLLVLQAGDSLDPMQRKVLGPLLEGIADTSEAQVMEIRNRNRLIRQRVIWQKRLQDGMCKDHLRYLHSHRSSGAVR